MLCSGRCRDWTYDLSREGGVQHKNYNYERAGSQSDQDTTPPAGAVGALSRLQSKGDDPVRTAVTRRLIEGLFQGRPRVSHDQT